MENSGQNGDVLTPRQWDIAQWLLQQYDAGAAAPSVADLCMAMGVSSRGSMHKHVSAMVEAGVVEDPQGQARGLRLTRNFIDSQIGIPLAGRIAAGQPILAVADNARLDVPDWLTDRGHCYALEVRGDSMVDDGILDGDYVVVTDRAARNGDVVVALVEGHEATLKRYFARDDRVELRPANAAMQSMIYPADQVEIQGVMVSLLRRY